MTAAPAMPIKAIAPWYGSKRMLAERIRTELGEHRMYFEPFCGSMAVLLAKASATSEIVNDQHGDLVNLARVIQCRTLGPQLYRRLRRTLCHQELHAEACDRLETEPFAPGLERAYLYFVASWMGRNGISGTRKANQPVFARRYTPGGGQGATRFQSAVTSIPAWRRRMARVVIEQRDAFDLIASIDDHPDVAIYCDPPYIEKTDRYVHDFEGDGAGFAMCDDHRRLADLLGGFKQARVVVSYYDHPHLADLFPAPKWTKIDTPTIKNMAAMNRRGVQKIDTAPEVLLVNGPVFGSAEAAA